ncbi:corticoliberin [Latimeria chalumnae]|uniref:Corticotropin releasing hormone n=1 Tax=Latimeria chalumnae TaxID=7897 RepID=H2ZZW5_LATCH|nr:PREDICTED: corticoliberin [Latimeria chalumnae]|eukprot:XP_006009185.1 PREDICTED: corticoliberin [Latimeria chalumnae]
MKFQLLVSTGILLIAIIPFRECRAIKSSAAEQTGSDPQLELQQQPFPLLVRIGEEYFIRLGNLNENLPSFLSNIAPESLSAIFTRALHIPSSNHLLQGKADTLNLAKNSYGNQANVMIKRGKRAEETPISLDLTFHLLREVLEMARAEQLAQQAHSNRKLMDMIGK